MSFNRVILMGRLGADPEIKHFENGVIQTKFRLATNRPTKQKVTDWHNCRVTTFPNTNSNAAEFAKEHFKKGSQILVEGELRTDSWTDTEGKKQSMTYVQVAHARFADDGPKKKDGGSDEDWGPEPPME